MSTAAIAEIPAAPLTITLHVSDPDVRETLETYSNERERHDFAVDALRVGVVALRQVEGQIDARKVREEGDRLIQALEGVLSGHRGKVVEQVESNLREYLDPKDGRFQERVQRLIGRDGELEQMLRSQVGADGSALVNTLQEHLGVGSPLMRKLDPEAKDGLLLNLDATLRTVLDAQREQILCEFSMDNREGALVRLVTELQERNGQLSKDLGERVSAVAAEFSLDEENSALSRLVRSVEQAQTRISSEFTLDDKDSALARLRKEVLEVLEAQQKKADVFQAEVRETLASVAARRAEAARSTVHGHDFEDAVCSFLEHESQQAGDVPQRTGSTTGRIPKCKVGDAVIELGPDHAAAGARIVIEAKERKGVDLRTALSELETARKNRDAGVGLFVFSSRTAPADLAPLRRYGADVVLVWDAEDPSSDVVLAAGLEVARAISVQSRADVEECDLDLEELDQSILAIEKSLGGLRDIEKYARTARNSGQKILSSAQCLREALLEELGRLQAGMSRVRDFLTEE